MHFTSNPGGHAMCLCGFRVGALYDVRATWGAGELGPGALSDR